MRWAQPDGSAASLSALSPQGKIDYARLLREQGSSRGEIASKTGIPKTSLHRYLGPVAEEQGSPGFTC
ncbi:DNA invertase Pin-like site-specific DNA recombinase [Nocardia sp. GAS34]|uniref:helix-turn-helix domain-containing protein n=1 Tax=unclassified Nocardia TaxID=2637762 RepID=UPI003D1B0F9F